MSISSYFKSLGAPLKNVRWSWGGVCADGALVLRVWQDERKMIDGITYLRITNFAAFANNTDDLGYQERLVHLRMLEQGAEGFLVMCSVEDPQAVPRKIKDFNADEVFLGGKLLQIDGDYWIEMVRRIPASQFSARTTT